VAQTEAGASGAGRIFFETPVLKWGTKELSSFTDLQKTLAAVGIRTGSQLMRLTFERTEIPLEKAMAEITEYFQEIENPGASGAHSGPVGVSNLTPAPHSTTIISAITGEPNPEASDSININQPSTGSTPSEPSVAQTAASPSPAVAVPENTVVGPNHRSMTVFAAPSSSTPSAAMQPFDEEAYEATVPQIQLHQARLQAKSQNQRLLSDVEREEQERERAAKQAAIKEVKIKIKFPDESWVVATFTSLDSGASLYEHIKGIIRAENHPFALGYFGTKAMTVPNDPEIRLIKDLGFTGNTTVNLRWEPDASDEARKAPTMKEEFANKAKEYVVPEIPDVETGNNNNVPPKQSNNDKKDGSGGGGLGKGKVPKWLGKSFGKK
jgi:tether containing UBX domain for GLUT4